MRTAVWIHVVLFVASALLATWTWERGGRAVDVSQIRLLKLQSTDLTELTHHWPGGISNLQFVGPERAMQLHLLQNDNSLDAATDAPPTEYRVPPSDVVRRGLALLTPLWAQRRIVNPNAEQRTALGFDESERRMIVRTQGREFILQFGRETYGGDGRYVMLDSGPDVYLINAEVARNFEGPAKRLTESQLLTWRSADITRVKISIGRAPEQTFIASRSEQQTTVSFANKERPDTTVPAVRSLIQHLSSLHATGYALSTGIPTDALVRIRLESVRQGVVDIALTGPAADAFHSLHVGIWQVRLNPVAANQLLEAAYRVGQNS